MRAASSSARSSTTAWPPARCTASRGISSTRAPRCRRRGRRSSLGRSAARRRPRARGRGRGPRGAHERACRHAGLERLAYGPAKDPHGRRHGHPELRRPAPERRGPVGDARRVAAAAPDLLVAQHERVEQQDVRLHRVFLLVVVRSRKPGNGEGRDAVRGRGLQYVWSALLIHRTSDRREGQRDPSFVTASQHASVR